jgi:glycosyltransferase involved in cell wall biosynthesis
MKFVVEGLGLTAGGGKGIVAALLPALARSRQHEFVALLPRLAEYASIGAPNLKVLQFSKPRGLLGRSLFLHRIVPKICREEGSDALLCLGNFAPLRPPVPVLISLRNAFYVSPPRQAPPGLSVRERLIVRYARWHFMRLPRNIFLTVETALMRDQFLNAYPVAPARVAVISNGADAGAPQPLRGVYREPLCCAPSDSQSSEPAQGRLCRPMPHLKGRSGGEGPFTFLSLARYYPHKNLEMCVEAVKRVAATGRQARLLMTIDGGDHPRARRLLRRMRREGLETLVQNLGTLPPSALPRAYASADALLLPSLIESFSRTYLEAMCYGLPIVTSNRDFARHICGDAALYADPLDVESVASAMIRVMEDGRLRQTLAAQGRERAAHFPSWDEIARQFVAILESIALGDGLPVLSRQGATTPWCQENPLAGGGGSEI